MPVYLLLHSEFFLVDRRPASSLWSSILNNYRKKKWFSNFYVILRIFIKNSAKTEKPLLIFWVAVFYFRFYGIMYSISCSNRIVNIEKDWVILRTTGQKQHSTRFKVTTPRAIFGKMRYLSRKKMLIDSMQQTCLWRHIYLDNIFLSASSKKL